jgi:hypothetical protein
LLREQPFSAPKRLSGLENEEKIKLLRFQYPHAFISQLWNFFNVLNQEEKCEKIGNHVKLYCGNSTNRIDNTGNLALGN